MNDHVLAGRYRSRSLLGQGGMGAVWLAHDEHLDREVAVKELRLPDHLDDDQRRTWIARLHREARAAARLKHPGIVTVYDSITGEDGRPWIVMELVRGRSLADLLRKEGPLPPAQAAGIGLQMLSALRAAHKAGITHRDVKPANVLLEDGRVILTDFGIAAMEGDATLTRTGAVVGTPAYMSPEQVRGIDVTAASDLWALGATLYAAVEGRPPFGGVSTGAIFIAIATEDPPPAERAGPLGPTIMALLRRDPGQRPTADQLHDQLSRIVRTPTPPPAQPTLQESPSWLMPGPAPAPVPSPMRGAAPVPMSPDQPRPAPTPWLSRQSRRTKAVLIGTSVAAALALVTAVAVPTIDQRQKDAAIEARYEANARTLRSMHPPLTELGTSPTMAMLAGGRAEATYVLCDDSGGCEVLDKVTAVRNWLTAQKGATLVRDRPTTEDCSTSHGCYFVTRVGNSNRTATISEEDYSDGGRLLLKLVVGP